MSFTVGSPNARVLRGDFELCDRKTDARLFAEKFYQNECPLIGSQTLDLADEACKRSGCDFNTRPCLYPGGQGDDPLVVTSRLQFGYEKVRDSCRPIAEFDEAGHAVGRID